MKPGDGLILDDEIPPAILIIKSITESTLDYDRPDRIGGRKRCILLHDNHDGFLYLGRFNAIEVYGYPKNGIIEARLQELFSILSLSSDRHSEMREKVVQEIAETHAQRLVEAKIIATNEQLPPREIANLSLTELDHFRSRFQPQSHNEFYLTREPFVASLELVKADGSKELLLICRGYTPLRLDPLTPGAMYASYLAPKGSLASGYPGMTIDFKTSYRGDDNRSVLIWKSTFTPTQDDLTDALIATQGKISRLNSMRRFDIYHEVEIPATESPVTKEEPLTSPKTFVSPPAIPRENTPLPPITAKPILFQKSESSPEQSNPVVHEQIPEAAQIDDVEPSSSFTPAASPHRQTKERGVALPMKAILDPIQDAIFRSPLNSRIRISGGPGTGKTTVLLKRLSQKNKFEFLTDEEKILFQGDRVWKEQDWYLFSPSDLLKGYLEKALAKESLPAGDEHVKVYSTFRNEILRDLGVLRVGKHGTLTFSADDHDATQRGQIDREYVVSFANYLQGYYARTIHHHAATVSSELSKICEIVRAHLEHSRVVSAEPILREIENIEQQLSTSALPDQIRARDFIQRAIQISERANSAHKILTQSLAVSGIVKNQCEKLVTLSKIKPFEMIFDKMADLYLEFRDHNPDSSPHRIKQRSVCSGELDLLLFATLETVHQLWNLIIDETVRVPSKIKHLSTLLRVNICIDEVTDFSPLEVACMEKFAVPRTGGITICGDLMQRVTSRGIDDWCQLDIFSRGFIGHELAIAYRQTGRLFAIAKDLFLAKTGLESVDFMSAYPIQNTDPPALAVCLDTVDGIASWVSERIFEIFGLCDQHLPTIAILVPDSDSIEAIASKLRALLVPAGIEVDASPSGALLGNPSRIRIFPVTAIKGLEFEAVFYVDLDIMAKLQPDLIDKYVYVGLSRARSFLAVTYRESFPSELDEIVGHFIDHEGFVIENQ